MLGLTMWPNHAMQLTPSTRHVSCLAYQPQESRRAPGVADLLPLGGYCAAAHSCYRSQMTIKAIVHPAEEGGFWAEVPAMPGCVTQGESIDEVRANLREAVEGWLDAGAASEVMSESDQILELAL
jgi:predicted RNase H-like HicB family nuclease